MNNGDRPPYLTVPKFFERYQHYHDHENMLWVKLQTNTMHDKKVQALSENGRLRWYELLQLAGYYLNAIPNDMSAIAREANSPQGRVAAGVKELLDAGLLREAIYRPASRPKARKPTGWRMVRGSHGISYVPDRRGTDRLPPRYGARAA